jgi:hypothetical protein
MVEFGIRLSCFLPVTGTVLQASTRKRMIKNRPIRRLGAVITVPPFQIEVVSEYSLATEQQTSWLSHSRRVTALSIVQ